tara:strand:- start:1368 stop:1655 length:288 start_codon:yes stop_codon:yes gene_type:complete
MAKYEHEKFVDYFYCNKNWDDLDWFKFLVEYEGRQGLVTAEHDVAKGGGEFFVTWREWFGGDNFGENKRVWISGHDTVQLIKETGDIYGMKEELV